MSPKKLSLQASRREFFTAGMSGLGGLGLATLLADEGRAAPSAANPLTPKAPAAPQVTTQATVIRASHLFVRTAPRKAGCDSTNCRLWGHIHRLNRDSARSLLPNGLYLRTCRSSPLLVTGPPSISTRVVLGQIGLRRINGARFASIVNQAA